MAERNHSNFFDQNFFRISYNEKIIKSCEKYEIISFTDPLSGYKYNTNEIIDLKLFDYSTAEFTSINKYRISLDEALKKNYVQIKLSEHYYEEFSQNTYIHNFENFKNEDKSFNEKKTEESNDQIKAEKKPEENKIEQNIKTPESKEILWDIIIVEIDDLNSNVLDIEKELTAQKQIILNIEELFFRLNETETLKRRLDKIIEAFKRNLNLTQEFYKTNQSNVSFDELRIKHKNIDSNIEKMKKEILCRAKNYNDLNEVFKKLKQKFCEFMDQMNFFEEQITKIKTTYNKYPDQLSNLAQNEIDLLHIEKIIKSKNVDLHLMANMSQKFNDLVNININILNEFKKNHKNGTFSEISKQEDCKIIENFYMDAKKCFENHLNMIDQIKILNNNLNMSSSLIMSIEQWFRSFELKFDEEFQKIILLENKKDLDQTIMNLELLSDETNQKKNCIQKLEKIEEQTSFIFENVTNSLFKNKKWPYYSAQINSIQTKVLNAINSLSYLQMTINTNNSYLDEKSKVLDDLQLNKDLSVKNIAIIIENLEKLISELNEKLRELKILEFDNKVLMEHLNNNICTLSQKASNKIQKFNKLKQILESYESNMNHIQYLIDKKDYKNVDNNFSFDLVLKNLNEDKNELENSKKEIFDNVIKVCLNEIEIKYVPEFLDKEKSNFLLKKVEEKNLQLNEKIEFIKKEISDIVKIKSKYCNLVERIDKWIFDAEKKLSEPIGSNFAELETQYEINENILSEYKTKLVDLEELNNLKLNLSNFAGEMKIKTDDNYQIGNLCDFENKQKQINIKFDSIGKKANDRRASLLENLDKFKSLEEEVDNINNRSQELKLNVLQINNSIVKNNLDDFEDQNYFNFYEEDLLKLKFDFDFLKQKIEKDHDQNIKSKFQSIEDNITCIESIIQEIKDVLNENTSYLLKFEKLFNDLSCFLEKNQSKINKINVETKNVLLCEENHEFKLFELNKAIKDIDLGEKKIKDLNQFVEQNFNSKRILEKSIKANSNYDIFVKNFESTSYFIKNLIDLITNTNDIEEKFISKSSEIKDLMDGCLNDECLSKDIFKRIDLIENSNLKSMNEFIEKLENNQKIIIDCVKSFCLLVLHQNIDSNDIIVGRKIEITIQKIKKTLANFSLFKKSLLKYSNEMNNFNETKNSLLNLFEKKEKEFFQIQNNQNLNFEEKNDFFIRTSNELDEYNQILQNLIQTNDKIERFHSEKPNHLNRKTIAQIQEHLSNLSDKSNSLKKSIDLCENFSIKLKKFKNNFEIVNKEITESDHCDNVESIENFLLKLNDLIKTQLGPILDEFNDANIEIIKTELDHVNTKITSLKAKLEEKKTNIQRQNQKIMKNDLEIKKSILQSLEKDMELNFEPFCKKNEMIKRIEEAFSDEAKLRANLKVDDALKKEIDYIEIWQKNLLEKIEEKFSLSNQLQNFESRFCEIDKKLQDDVQNFDLFNSVNFFQKIDDLNKANSQLKIIRNELEKILDDCYNNSEERKGKSKFDQSSENFEKRIKEIIDRCDILQKLSTEKEKFLKEKLDSSIKIEEKIEQLKNQLKTSNSELDYLLKNLESLGKDDLKNHFEENIKKADDFKSDLNHLSNEIEILGLKINVENLEVNLIRFRDGLQKLQQKMESSFLKSCEYEQKVLNLEQNVLMIENEMDLMSKVKYNFSNLDFIESNLTELDVLMKKLVCASNEIDELKELSEKMLQNFTFNKSCNTIEKTMDSIVHKWNQMTRKIDEKRSNLIFLNEHLRKLACDFQKQIVYFESLGSNSSCKLVLNCVDPFVIKYQFEKMKTIYDNLNQRNVFINEIKQDAAHLTRLNQDFETQLNLLKTDQIIDSDNKYIEFLSKSVSIASLNNLVNLLDSDEIFASILLLENKSLYFKDLLDTNLNIFQRLYPLCENFSLNLSNLNQSISIIESDIEWLDNSNENEISLNDKEDLFEKTYQSIVKNENFFENDLQISLCSKIIDEINLKNIECNKLIDDLNKNIENNREKLNHINEKYNRAYENFQNKLKNSREIYSEMNDILEWLDIIESKYSDFNFYLLHDISQIENELNDQMMFNDEVKRQKLKLRQIDLRSRQKIRSKQIEDSIEFKEKLVNIQFQLDNYIEIGNSRVNRFEEALVVSKELKFTYEPFIKSMSMIQDRLNLLDSFNLINSGLEFKEILSNKMILIEEVERELLEKKSDLEILNKCYNNLLKICDSSKNYTSKLSNQSSESNFEDVQCLENNSNFEWKKIAFANQTYNKIKIDLEVKKDELENILWNSGDLSDKIDSLNSFLKIKIDFVESNRIISVHSDKINFQIKDFKDIIEELDKRKKSLDDVKESLKIKGSNTELNKKLKDLEKKWLDLDKTVKNHEKILNNALQKSELFWNNYNNINELINDLDERLLLLESETVAIDSDSVFEQQQYHQQIIKDIDENEANLIDLKKYKQQLIAISNFHDPIEVENAVENCEKSWNRIKKKVKKHEIDIQITFSKACEFQQELIEILEWISLQQEKFVNLDSSLNSDDPKTIRFQINLLKEFKEKVDPKQMEILVLNQKFDELKFNIRTNQSFEVLESLQEPLNSANKEWKRLQSSITERKSNLQNLLIDMGQLNDALDEIAKSIDININSLDKIENFFTSKNDIQIRSIDLKVARLKMIEKEIKSEDYLLARSKHKCQNLFTNESFENETNSNELRAKIESISQNNQLMKKKFEQLKENYDNELAQSLNLICELIDYLEWLNDVDASLENNFFYSGLPETAREEIAKFRELCDQIESNNAEIDNLLQRALECHENNLLNKKLDNMLKEATQDLSTKWNLVLKKSSDKKEDLENSFHKACDFNEKYHELIRWLNEIEKRFKSLKPFSKIKSTLDEQIKDHQELQMSINKQRENILELNQLGTHLKYYCQKQDSILIKNLLISIQNRWDKIVSKSSNRTRDLERGYQEVKIFNEEWNKINEWLDSNINTLSQDQSTHIGNNSIKIKQQIAKHADFHRMINSQQSAYDKILKVGRKLHDKCDQGNIEQNFIHEMLRDIKNKWNILCIQSVERQKKLEEALLYSGQFQDALNNLVEWLKKVKPTLSKNETLFGDLDNVMALIEDNQQFQKSLQIKAEQVVLINKAANEMTNINDNDDDFKLLNEKLKEVNELWDDVEQLSKDRTKRLDESFKIATEFNQSARCCLEWLKNTELTFKQDWKKIDENEISLLIEDHQDFVNYLNENKHMIDKCLDLGHRLLENCIPEAVNNLKHFISLIQNKWDEIDRLAEEKLIFLNEALENCKKYDNLLNELITWLVQAETKLNALDQEPLSANLEIIDHLLKNHVEFQNELEQRQVKVDMLLKNSLNSSENFLSNKMIDSKKIFDKKNRHEWKKSESKITNSRIKLMFEKWRKVVFLTHERQKKLIEFSERLKEIEKLKDFNFDEWRQRYMNWHKDNRARITDFFRRQDKDHDGKISRDEFVKGILNTNFPSSRLELECVADIFDHDKDGFIDYKEFLATLKSSMSSQPNFERIRDEVHRQVSLCKCSKQYHVLQVSERHFRFGDSQKLRLVRILQSTVMVRVGGGWMALDEFLIKNDPCRGKYIFNEFIKIINNQETYLAKGKLNIDLRDQFMLRDTITNNEFLKSPCKFKNQNVMNNGKKNNQPANIDQSNITTNKSFVLGEKNSKTGSLGASINDLSLDAFSGSAENLEKTKVNLDSLNSSPRQSKLPILKKY